MTKTREKEKMDKQYLVFLKMQPLKKQKTEVWVVKVSSNYGRLGYIKWYSPWSMYVFFPEVTTLYSSGYLKEIILFIDGLMARR